MTFTGKYRPLLSSAKDVFEIFQASERAFPRLLECLIQILLTSMEQFCKNDTKISNTILHIFQNSIAQAF